MPGIKLRTRVAADIAAAWRARFVKRGFLGTVLIALGSISAAYLPRSTPIWRWLDRLSMTGMPFRILGTVVTMTGLLLLVDAWLRLRPGSKASKEQPYRNIKHWAVLLIWSAPFLLAPPIFSHDAYSYAAQGWQLVNGISPYDAGPAVLPGPFADQVAWVWRNTTAPYGPLSLRIQHLLVLLSGGQPYLAAVLQRIPALIGVAMISAFTPRVSRQVGANPAFAAWFAVLNPLLVIDFVGGAHNDSLMMGLVVLAVWVAGLKSRTFGLLANNMWLLGAAVIGVSAAIKQPAFLVAYALPLISKRWTSWRARHVAVIATRALISLGIAIGVFVLISLATSLGFGWLEAVNVPGRVITVAPFTLAGQVVQIFVDMLGIDPTGRAAVHYARSLGIAVAAVIVACLALSVARKKPRAFIAWGYLAAAICAPALRSWYILWGWIALPWAKPSPKAVKIACWFTLVLLCYDGINMAWRNDSTALGIALIGVIWLIARRHLLKNRISTEDGA